jgi:hypothetical protein
MSELEDKRRPEQPSTAKEDREGPPTGTAGSRRSAQDYDTNASEYEGGYGGGRERGENWPEHGFGDRGWGGGRAKSTDSRESGEQDEARRDLPQGATPVPDGPGWQEQYARENADKYGQSGGQPTAGRGPSQSHGGYEHREADIGSTDELSERGGLGIRETETIETKSGAGARVESDIDQQSDEEVREEINRRLTEHPALDATGIEVQVQQGQVTLAGTVDDRDSKYIAQDIAHEVPGTRQVHNRIRLMARDQTTASTGEPTKS